MQTARHIPPKQRIKLSQNEVMDLYYEKRHLVLTALAAALAGIALHFLYFLWPNALTALLAPINESLWEHVKLVFWPYLLAALWLNRGRPGGLRPWLLTLPLLCLVLLGLGFLYHVLLHGGSLWVSVAIYLLTMALGFWLPTRFSGPFSGVRWHLPAALVVVLGILIALFTLWPPESLLFVDRSVGNWFLLPC